MRSTSRQGRVHTRYQDRSHHIQFLFYSPEGLSIELSDDAEYDVQVIDHDKAVMTVPASARYIVVLTPSEVRWRVRVMQADSRIDTPLRINGRSILIKRVGWKQLVQ